MQKFRVAGFLLVLQGGVMELGVLVAAVPLLLLGVDQDRISERFSFIVPYLQDNLYLMMVMSGVFGAVRLIGAFGLLQDRMWGLALSIINCTVTMALMIFLLPAGILDGIFSCTALILILVGYFGPQRIADRTPSRLPASTAEERTAQTLV